jgi:hypothetical protein
LVELLKRAPHKTSNELLAKSPRTVAITTTVYTMPRPVRQIVEIVREHNPDTRIVVGGPHIFNTCPTMVQRLRLFFSRRSTRTSTSSTHRVRTHWRNFCLSCAVRTAISHAFRICLD